MSKKESTKEELSAALNELFGVDVDFTKMIKADLEKLVKAFEEPTALLKVGIQQLKAKAINKPLRDLLDRPLSDLMDRPTLLKSVTQSKNGPLGLGILPRIIRRAGSKTEE